MGLAMTVFFGYNASMTRRDMGDIIFRRIMIGCALIIVAIVLTMLFQLTGSSWLSIKKFGLGFVFSSTWDPVFEVFGAWPFIYGTLVSSFVALLIAIPIGLGTAIYLAEYAPWGVRRVISTLVDLLAAIPSVVYGLWAIFELVPLMRTTIQPFLGKRKH